MAIKMPDPEQMQRAAEEQRRQQNRAAVAQIRKRLESEDGDASLYLTLGTAHLNLGEFAAARDALQQAVKIDREFLHAWTNLAVAHYELGEFSQAAASARRALVIREGFLPARMNLAMASLMLGEFVEAEQQFRAVLSAEPEMPVALAGMVKALTGQDRVGEAMAYKLKAVQAGVCFEEDAAG